MVLSEGDGSVFSLASEMMKKFSFVEVLDIRNQC